MIKRLVKLTFQADKTDDFIAIFEESKHFIRNTEGCRHLELLRDKTDANVFFTLSVWETAESLENYRHSNLFRTTWAKTKILFSAAPQAWSTEIVSKVEIF